MKVTIIPVVLGALCTVTKGSIQGLEDLEISLLNYWDRPEYWEESWRLEETWCHSNSSEKPSAYTGVKNLQASKIMIIKRRKMGSLKVFLCFVSEINSYLKIASLEILREVLPHFMWIIYTIIPGAIHVEFYPGWQRMFKLNLCWKRKNIIK